MSGLPSGAVGESPDHVKGFPHLSAIQITYTVRRTALAMIAIAAFGLALSAASVAVEGYADSGVVIDPSGRTVADVSPTGFAWRDGIRPGQVVITLKSAVAPEGWSIETMGPAGSILSRAAPIQSALRGSGPIAAIGLAFAALAVVFLRTNRTWALPLASASLVAGSVPLFLANHEWAAPALITSALVPTTWALTRLRRWPVLAAALAVGGGTLMASWWFAYFSGSEILFSLDQARRIVAIGGTGLLFVDRGVQDFQPGAAKPVTATRALIDLVALLAAGAALVVVNLSSFPVTVVAVLVVLVFLAVAPLRRYLGRRLESLLMADLRKQVEADVAEEERARLARELHDVPLQQLSGVIRRLELVPDAKEATGSLLAIADELRAVAVELRPPMLDDLGLGAALDYLAEQATDDEHHVEVNIEDRSGPEPERRPPAAVELAVYRIANEAVTNAVSHGRSSEISIIAAVSPSAIRLEIADDGVGINDQDARRASSRGRLGLASMRRRAQAIGAELSIQGTRAGTKVVVTWQE
jgi:signal transduction histidine kinase